MNLNIYKNLYILEKGVPRKGRYVPVKVPTRGGYVTTVYKKPGDLILQKMDKTRKNIFNMFLGQAYSIANSYASKKTGVSYVGKEDIKQDALLGLYDGVMSLSKNELLHPDSPKVKTRIRQRILKAVEEATMFEQSINGFVKEWNAAEGHIKKVADVVSMDQPIKGDEEATVIGDFIADQVASPEDIIMEEEGKREYSSEKIKYYSILKQMKSILTDTEFNTLIWSMDGKSSREIGKLLHMSPAGVLKVLDRSKTKLANYGKELLKIETFEYKPESDNEVVNVFKSVNLPVPQDVNMVRVEKDDVLGTDNYYLADKLIAVKYGDNVLRMP